MSGRDAAPCPLVFETSNLGSLVLLSWGLDLGLDILLTSLTVCELSKWPE